MLSLEILKEKMVFTPVSTFQHKGEVVSEDFTEDGIEESQRAAGFDVLEL
jgi:hypothetical protein